MTPGSAAPDRSASALAQNYSQQDICGQQYSQQQYYCCQKRGRFRDYV